jgi:hypothetical protein
VEKTPICLGIGLAEELRLQIVGYAQLDEVDHWSWVLDPSGKFSERWWSLLVQRLRWF